MQRVTLTDIAKALGLSASTVGLVVSNNKSPLRKHLNKETVRRVEEKAREMGYQPNRAARIMRGARTNLIIFFNMGVLAEWVNRQAYQIGLLTHELGYDYQVIDAWWGVNGNGLIDQVIAMRPEGVIVSGNPQTTEMDFTRFHEAGIPLVSLDLGLPKTPWVRHGIKGAISTLVSSCLASGRKRPALLVRKENYTAWQTRERCEGFQTALEQAGWAPPINLDLCDVKPKTRFKSAVILHDESPIIAFRPFLPGREAAQRVGTSVDAFFLANDDYATGALTYYLQNNIDVPEKIALSGFDNLAHTTEGKVPLTTVAFPTEAMCRKAMDLLVEQIGGTKMGEEEHVFPCEIMWRQSMTRPTLERSGRTRQVK